ncbi:transcription factor GTE10-like [Asparagus officinalis]|nr:transcription factor GTE10-like [Asparagus officinalis]
MAPTVLIECTEKRVVKRSFAMMGKSQKFSKGLSSSFVPDYRHAAETMEESEGFGSSCRVDSEDSCAPKRKCISLNKDTGDCFNVPLQVISFAKMPGSERKELELRLRAELERIQMLQKKFLSINVPTVSSSSNGKKLGSNGSHLKRGSSGRFESKNKQRPQPQPTTDNSYASIMKQCDSILNKLRTHQFGWVFNNPVDAVALKIPDYYTVIKHPMDLGTIKNKISSGAYSSPLGFVADVRLTFTNAMTYNPPGNDVHIMADKLSKFFESKWKPIEKKLAATDLYVRRETEAPKPVLHPKKRKTSPVTCNAVVLEKVIPRVTAEERQHLSNRLSAMLEDMPDQIIDFLKRHISSTNDSGEEEMEVDIDALSDDVLLELRELLDSCLPEKLIVQHPKAEPSEIEILNESGLSNSSMHPGKGNEPVDEDVDIGGNDPPMSSYPPVEIEKDAIHRGGKCSSSSSSSSDSGSSSSDSDSGSSSGSDSEDKGATPGKTTKANKRPETVQDQDKSDIMNPIDAKRSVSGLDLSHQDAHPNPMSSEADGPQDGENAPPERQVSPEKLYRAALLRSRFADTILKAQEKTLVQGEKGDPERLRQEREELERKQREEKARLQA